MHSLLKNVAGNQAPGAVFSVSSRQPLKKARLIFECILERARIIGKEKMVGVSKSKATKSRLAAPKSKAKGRVKIELHGKASIDRKVGTSGKTGRIYVPPEWIGHQVFVIRLD